MKPERSRVYPPKLLCRVFGHYWILFHVKQHDKYGMWEHDEWRCKRCDLPRFP